ncbi:Probable RNA-directed DNA polymerase from transposon X-element [Eumeta japonica]|uniref:Probable RNA-directed DNA polymerase from transposon X-element n=1 Tax=Eumeta variegata TaxID=151549 RepID=A0A4C1W147_EUMVA|nr:Probable RNA-directed DNA polymerase from transposon X-element [Eumeta japonica]
MTVDDNIKPRPRSGDARVVDLRRRTNTARAAGDPGDVVWTPRPPAGNATFVSPSKRPIPHTSLPPGFPRRVSFAPAVVGPAGDVAQRWPLQLAPSVGDGRHDHGSFHSASASELVYEADCKRPDAGSRPFLSLGPELKSLRIGSRNPYALGDRYSKWFDARFDFKRSEKMQAADDISTCLLEYYKPISVLSGLGKLFERILKTHLSDHLLGKGLTIDEQFGFWPVHSCPQQVLRLVEYISEGFKSKQKTVAVFFDVAKAFDRVWHAGLIYKFHTLNILDRLIHIIHNYISNRHFTFRYERTHSTRRRIRAGVPQGSSLSPLLYSAYTNDIPRPLSGVQLALFADDAIRFTFVLGSKNLHSSAFRVPLMSRVDGFAPEGSR